MKRSFLAIALLACASLAAVAYAAVAPLVTAVANFIKTLVIDGVALVARVDSGRKSPAVILVQAKSFVQRMAKRERPVVTSTWRMCPSI